jgi:ankyrin repeat protein
MGFKGNDEFPVKVNFLFYIFIKNIKYKMSETELFDAVQKGNLTNVKLYIGTDIHAKNKDGTTPIMLACKRGHMNVIDYLISQGANVNDTDRHGFPSIWWAFLFAHDEIVNKLMANGANIESVISYHIGKEELNKEKKEIMKESVEKWNASMLMIVLEELGVLNQVDPDSIIDYQEFL